VKRITDLRVGDSIWVRRKEIFDFTSVQGGTFVKLMVLEFKIDQDTGNEYIIARELNESQQFNINLSGFGSVWFINNPEVWDSSS